MSRSHPSLHFRSPLCPPEPHPSPHFRSPPRPPEPPPSRPPERPLSPHFRTPPHATVADLESEDEEPPYRPTPSGNRRASASPHDGPPAVTTTPAPIVKGRIHKISSKLLIPFDPDAGPTSRYCDNLRRLATMFGDQSVIAHLPSTFEGRTMDWFNSNTMSTEEMETVEGWISVLKREFVVNSAKAKEKASKRHYNPATDKSLFL